MKMWSSTPDSIDPLALSWSRRTVLAGTMACIPGAAFAEGRRDADLDTFLTTQLRAGGFPGMAIGVARKGRVLFTRGHGFADIAGRRPVTAKTVFHLASITKTVTATAVMMLAEARKIDLDAPVGRYLDFSVTNPAHPKVAITVRHLLMHMSSISDETYYKVDFRTPGTDSSQDLGAFLESYLIPGGAHYTSTGSFSSSAPGSAYDYSNVGYGLLGYLAGRVAGEDLRTFTKDRIFAPLGMNDVSWTIAGAPRSRMAIPYDSVEGRLIPMQPVGSPDFPGSMLRASVAGFMPFVAAAANKGATDTTRILTAESEAEMLSMHVPPGLPNWLSGQGLGWMESNEMGKRRINHWGGDPGVFTAVYLDPASTTGVAIFTNVTATPASKAALKAVAGHLFEVAGA